MLQPDLIQFLVESDSNTFDSIPVLQVDSKPKERILLGELATGDGGTEENISPFNFTPQRIRLNKDHEFFEDGDIHRHLYLQDLSTSLAEDSQTPNVSEFRCHIAGCSQLFDALEGYEHHYSALHRHVCSSCKRCLPSDRLLDIHILEWHDSLFQVMAQKRSMYQCLVEGCGSKFNTSQERRDHLIKTHSYPPDFRFDKSKNSKSRTKEKTTQKQKEVSMEISGITTRHPGDPESCQSMDLSQTQEPVKTDPTQMEQPKLHYSYRVPSSICFGQGSVRGFRGGRRKK